MNINSRKKLNTGHEIPYLGLGTYLLKSGRETYNAVRAALDYGYRHIDTAAFYGNEEDVGNAIKESGIDRDQIFVTTKLWNSEHGYDKALNAFKMSMKKLDIEYIDLYLIHWPIEMLRMKSWMALEKLLESGNVRSIGVSNYTIRHLEELLASCDVKPAVNQVEFSPYLYQKELLEFCQKEDIAIEAYSPLTRAKKFSDEKLIQLSYKYSKSPAQVLIRWALQKDLIVLPKSKHPKRIEENADVFDFEISQDDMKQMDLFDEDFRVAWDPTTIT